jgi:hypothetical protein
MGQGLRILPELRHGQGLLCTNQLPQIKAREVLDLLVCFPNELFQSRNTLSGAEYDLCTSLHMVNTYLYH